jgi:hypothetical protein
MNLLSGILKLAQVASIGGRQLTLRFPIVVDWIALLCVFNNCPKPNARFNPNTLADPHICGLCDYRASDKQHGWRSQIGNQWRRDVCCRDPMDIKATPVFRNTRAVHLGTPAPDHTSPRHRPAWHC